MDPPHGRSRSGPQSVSFCGAGLTLRGDQYGTDGQRGDLLFLHGGGQTRHSWGGAAALLAEAGWTCVTIDLRGHGDSDWSADERYGIGDHVADVRNVVAQMKSIPVIIGASLGGLTALTLEGQSPATRALVLVDIVPRTVAGGVRRIRSFMTEHLGGFASLDEVADAVAAYNRRPRKRNLDGLRKNVRKHADGRWYWHWDPAIMNTKDVDDPKPGVDPEMVLSGARQVTVPVLIVRGLLSDVVDDDGIEELLRAVRNGRVIDVPAAGHMVAGDDNDVFVAALSSFLRSLDA